ncbi:ComEC/Rec2 family competence protein [Solidesulfovibrio aerotolerans]|uniref:ComEC/Rec2 family competence protein n=1 Tax=Solidesulfovibrio aerotolerans TaxID=295255 RepID=UPI0031B57188
MHPAPDQTVPRSVPPLLPWQPCFLAYAAGILAGTAFVPALFALALLLCFPRPLPGSPRLTTFLLAFGLGLGAGYWAMPALPQASPACVTKAEPVTAVGVVTEVDPRPENRLAVILKDVRLTERDATQAALPGRLAATIDHPGFEPTPGDVLAITGRVRTTAGFSNPGTTDFAFLRRLDGVFFRTYARGDRDQVKRLSQSDNGPALWRQALRQHVAQALATPPDGPAMDAAARAGRAMVPALLFDDKSGFTEDDLDLVRRASLAHTLALSGMNVAYVVTLATALILVAGKIRPGLYLRLPRPRLIVLAAAPLVVAYCWIGGASPSLLRAALMFAAFGLMLLLGRDKALFDGLFLALAAFLVVSPLAVYSASLQLSALAVAGMALFWQLFRRLAGRIPGSGLPRTALLWTLGILWTSVSAEVAVLPLLARIFGELAFNPWINLLWLPVLGGVVMPLVLCGAAIVAIPGLAQAGGLLLTLAAECCAWLMRALAFFDAQGLLVSQAVLRPQWPALLGCYGLLAALAFPAAGRAKPRAAILASLALLLIPATWQAVQDSRQNVSLTVLDVGQGQSVVVTIPGGKRLLIDAGGLFGNFDVGRAVVGAFLTDGRRPRIEMALASHPHSDHIKGFVSLLSRFEIGAFYDNGGRPEASLAAPIEAALARRNIPRKALAAGDNLDLGQGLALEVLHPGPDDDLSTNNGSLILRLTQNGHGLALFPGDAQTAVLRKLAQKGHDLRADVLVLPHHGSSSSLANASTPPSPPRSPSPAPATRDTTRPAKCWIPWPGWPAQPTPPTTTAPSRSALTMQGRWSAWRRSEANNAAKNWGAAPDPAKRGSASPGPLRRGATAPRTPG